MQDVTRVDLYLHPAYAAIRSPENSGTKSGWRRERISLKVPKGFAGTVMSPVGYMNPSAASHASSYEAKRTPPQSRMICRRAGVTNNSFNPRKNLRYSSNIQNN